MSEPTARQRRDEERRRRILDLARDRADVDGWSAVTTRHLADAIGYTQPVLYRHFPDGKTEIMRTIALEGFVELTRRCREAVVRAKGKGAAAAVATSYLDFAGEHPAVYEAMFQQAIDTRFASEDTPPELRAGFDVLREAIGDAGEGARTEVFWAALHGICQLEGAGRMRPEHRADRVTQISRLYD